MQRIHSRDDLGLACGLPLHPPPILQLSLPPQPPTLAGKLVVGEDRASGGVAASVYGRYLGQMGMLPVLVISGKCWVLLRQSLLQWCPRGGAPALAAVCVCA